MKLPAPHSAICCGSRRGASMIIAITMIGFVAIALAMVGQLATLDARRTADEHAGTQLRMMLLAGQDWLLNNMDAVKPGENHIPLPASLADGTLVAQPSPDAAANNRQVVIRATLLDREQSQTLVIVRSSDAWSIASAELGALRRK